MDKYDENRRRVGRARAEAEAEWEEAVIVGIEESGGIPPRVKHGHARAGYWWRLWLVVIKSSRNSCKHPDRVIFKDTGSTSPTSISPRPTHPTIRK